ncbi:diguanylate cyclase (GGDEF)-like protein [Hoeflea halophila]|uniref:Diguanylate cyclase (GGDEF)-like protein n=1 Tax=Hoeflea halophila TaxID=714899 RepID=A0A286HT57_9HYPH|nr:EAL domain-containing protein [Hoeflea halophila]SOE10972.1 diguanylate cyclase (GGDEF)-like protein [Hoeflea halophila]
MNIAPPVDQRRKPEDATRQQAIAQSYVPILRPILIPACAYYVFVTWEHSQTQTGALLAMYSFISMTTAVSFYFFHRLLSVKGKIELPRLEVITLMMHLFMYFNLVSYLLVYNVQTRYIYFVVLAFIFAITSATTRTMLASVSLALGTLYWFASSLPADLFAEYASIAVATAFAAISIAGLLRRAILRQIDARLLADELTVKARALADSDMLTGIPNRRAIFEQIDLMVARRKPFWLGIFDLDGFKGINDVYGHVTGDRLLCAAVDRASEMVSAGVTIGRIGGDEFVAIVPGDVTEAELRQRVESRIRAMSVPYIIDQIELTVGASAGFTHFPDTGLSTGQLYEQADFALYKAKSQFRGQCVLFDTAENTEMKQAIAIERELREGNLAEELYLLFQPQYSPGENRVLSFEALARWQSPKLGRVGPDQFIRVAERSGSIQKLTSILFQKGLAELATWPQDVSLSFNLSARDISDQAFILSLLGQIMKSELSPSRIEFEITETAVMSDLVTATNMIEILRSSGCKIALDDFGSGYSSFGYLDQLPLDKVKIDRSFIRRVPHSATSREIVSGIISLCRKLDLRCVLEGVETEDEMTLLESLNPDLIQGYLYGRPMSGDDARRMLSDQQVSAAIEASDQLITA